MPRTNEHPTEVYTCRQVLGAVGAHPTQSCFRQGVETDFMIGIPRGQTTSDDYAATEMDSPQGFLFRFIRHSCLSKVIPQEYFSFGQGSHTRISSHASDKYIKRRHGHRVQFRTRKHRKTPVCFTQEAARSTGTHEKFSSIFRQSAAEFEKARASSSATWIPRLPYLFSVISLPAFAFRGLENLPERPHRLRDREFHNSRENRNDHTTEELREHCARSSDWPSVNGSDCGRGAQNKHSFDCCGVNKCN